MTTHKELPELLTALAKTGTTEEKLTAIADELSGYSEQLSRNMLQQRLEGKVPNRTIWKLANLVENGVAEPIPTSEVNPANFVQAGELAAVQSLIGKQNAQLVKIMTKVDELADKLAGEREARIALQAQVDELTSVVTDAK